MTSRCSRSKDWMIGFVGILWLSAHSVPASIADSPTLLDPDRFRPYIESFNAHDEELYVQHIPNTRAWEFLRQNIPWFTCPDPDIERTYYFRWWTFRKHIRQTPDGFVITEFLPNVPWSGKHNTINCPAGHHFYEGRWLKDRRYLDDYSRFWFRKGGSPRSYSFWAADAYWARYTVTLDREWIVDLLPDLVANYRAWERMRFDPEVGLFWQIDDRDGMEVSIGGSGYRATINSYMFGDAVAIARIAELAGQAELARAYRAKAARLKQAVQRLLWDPAARFFKVAPRPRQFQKKSAGILEWRVNNDLSLTRQATPSASHCWARDTVHALNDGREPRNSGDATIPRMTFWDHVGTIEWVQYVFPRPVTVSNVQVYWFEDRAGSRLPASWRLLAQLEGRWEPVHARDAYTTQPNRYNQVRFDPVTTRALRIEVELQGFTRSPVRVEKLPLADVRELHGYTPWYFRMPDPPYAVAWQFLTRTNGFWAPFGLTTAEQSHPGFRIAYQGHECQWNGPSWPYATAVTLTALANLLNDHSAPPVSRRDYFEALRIYARSHRLQREDGTVVPWIDENLNPYTGDWIARTLLRKRGRGPRERGKDYNHSTFCDLVITGLVGVRPSPYPVLLVHPLVPQGTWDWFALDGVAYHGHMLTVFYDRTGRYFGRGAGLQVWVDGECKAARPDLGRLEVPLP